jgi:hypothetical protein
MALNPNKGRYIADNGTERFTVDFFQERERDKAVRILDAWDDRIKTLMNIGHDFCKNGQALSDKFNDEPEGRIRTHVGLKLIEWAELLLFEAKDHPMDKQLEALDDIVSDVAKALGKTPEEVRAEMAEIENGDG